MTQIKYAYGWVVSDVWYSVVMSRKGRETVYV